MCFDFITRKKEKRKVCCVTCVPLPASSKLGTGQFGCCCFLTVISMPVFPLNGHVLDVPFIYLFNYIFPVCVLYMYVYTCFYVCVHVCLYVCIRRPRVDVRSHPLLLFHLIRRSRLSQSNPELTNMAVLASQLALESLQLLRLEL